MTSYDFKSLHFEFRLADLFPLLPSYPDLANRPANAAPLPRGKIEELRVMIEKQLETEAAAFERNGSGKRALTADDRFLQTALQSGTVSDRVAAMSLMVQQAPVQRLAILDRFVCLA